MDLLERSMCLLIQTAQNSHDVPVRPDIGGCEPLVK